MLVVRLDLLSSSPSTMILLSLVFVTTLRADAFNPCAVYCN